MFNFYYKMLFLGVFV